jgi:Zn-dependent protease
MQGDFLSWGLPAGRLAGIRIRIHWSLLVWWVYEFESVVRAHAPLWAWPLFVVLSFGAILLHEFGHCFAARRTGGRADRVLLWPLGGLAMCAVPFRWKAQLALAAGGPLVTAAIALAGYGVSLAVPAFSAASSSDALAYAYEVLVPYQLVLLVFNLIPAYPLDGGRMLLAGLWGAFERFGKRYDSYGRASVAAAWVTRVCAVAGIAYGALVGNYMLVCLAAWCLWEAQRLVRLEEGEGEAPELGCDRVSLARAAPREAWWRRLRRKLRVARWRRKWGAPLSAREGEVPGSAGPPGGVPGTNEQEKVDALLAKISARGLDALTREERAYLEVVGRRWSARRR